MLILRRWREILLQPQQKPVFEQHQRRREGVLPDQEAAAERRHSRKRNRVRGGRIRVISRIHAVQGETAVIHDVVHDLIEIGDDDKISFRSGFQQGLSAPLLYHDRRRQIIRKVFPVQRNRAAHEDPAGMLRHHSALKSRTAYAEVHDKARIQVAVKKRCHGIIVVDWQLADLKVRIACAEGREMI